MASTEGEFDATQLLESGAARVGGNAVERRAVGSGLTATYTEAVIAAEILGVGRERSQIGRAFSRCR